MEGVILAETLTRYSERGAAYVDDLKSIIRFNDFDGFDRNRGKSAGAEAKNTATKKEKTNA